MTQTQRAALDAALARAERDGIQVLGQGTRKRDGARVFAVSSASQPGRWYLVAIEASEADGGAGRLHCDCPARSYCKHRAAVHARLSAEREAERHAAEIAAEIAASQRAAEQEAERLHAQRLTAAECDHARDAAILYRSSRPFSLWRAE